MFPKSRKKGGGGDIQLFHDIKVKKHSNDYIKEVKKRGGGGGEHPGTPLCGKQWP